MLRSQQRRSGKVLALTALLLPALLGMVGLIVDLGLLLTAQQQVQAAVDAAALAAAQARLAGGSGEEARERALAVVQEWHGLAIAQVSISQPPVTGPQAGNSAFVEVEATFTVGTWFIPATGAASTCTVAARAVAGSKSLAGGEAVCLLDPLARPGLALTQGTLVINGKAAVNSQGAGQDALGNTVDLGQAGPAVNVGSGLLQTGPVRVAGGVDNPGVITPLPGQRELPLRAGQLLRFDPLRYLVTPTTSNGASPLYPGLDAQAFSSPQDVLFEINDGASHTLSPGIYQSITLTGAGPGSLTFQPGIYVLRGGNASGQALQITSSASITGSGVLFYNTGTDYAVGSGAPDSADIPLSGNDPGTTFGTITVQGAQTQLTSLDNSTSPLAGLLIYQRRRNAQPITLQVGSQQSLQGTIYARGAQVVLSGQGTLGCQVIAASLQASPSDSGSTITITPAALLARANLAYLVE